MIARADTPPRRRRFLAACGDSPVLGCVLPVQLAVFGRHSGCLFAGPAIAIDANGDTALAAGRCDPAELASFLGFLGCGRLLTDGPAPAGWAAADTRLIYTLAPGASLPLPPLAPGLRLSTEASPGAAAALLFGADPARQQEAYAQLCAKRNHGMARVWAVQAGDTVVSTVQAAAIWRDRAYMASGLTAPAWRGKGVGGHLIAAMANALAAEGKRVSFACRPALAPFYDRLGFVRSGALTLYAAPDAPEEENKTEY